MQNWYARVQTGLTPNRFEADADNDDSKVPSVHSAVLSVRLRTALASDAMRRDHEKLTREASS